MNPDLHPEYDEEEEPDYALADEDLVNEILNDLNIQNYDSVEKVLSQPEMTDKSGKTGVIFVRLQGMRN